MADLNLEIVDDNIPKGYKNHGEFSIQCLGCDKPCIKVTLADKSDKYPEQTVQVMCHKCGQLSFKKYIGRVKAFIDGVGNFHIADIQFIDNKLLLVEVK